MQHQHDELSMYTPINQTTAQAHLLDMLRSTPEVVNGYQAISGKVGNDLGYLPWLHWYEAGRGHVSTYLDNSQYPAIEIPRKVIATPGALTAEGETLHASTASWCNKVRINVEGSFANRFTIRWEEHIIPFVPPSPSLGGHIEVGNRVQLPENAWYEDGNVEWHFAKADGSAETPPYGVDVLHVALFALPPNYRWEVWRRRRKTSESGAQQAPMQPEILHWGHYTLYERLDQGVRTYLPPLKKEGYYRFAVYNTNTGARSYLCDKTVCVHRGGKAKMYLR